MKSIQMTALILWGIIFVVVAFVLGQFFVHKGILDVTHLFTITDGENINDSEENNENVNLEDEIVIDKIGQETVRVGQNIAIQYFSEYYNEFVSYVIASDKYQENTKISIDDNLASDYIFYAISNGIDKDKYECEVQEDKLVISEGNLNSAIDKMFAKEVEKTYKENVNNGYNKATKTYSVNKKSDSVKYIQNLISIENITSNELKLMFECKYATENKETDVSIYLIYRGGRYILTDVERIND